MSINERIKTIRLESGLNQEKFAESIGLKRGNYSQIELGHHSPSLEIIREIARIYNKSYDWLINGFAEGHAILNEPVAEYGSSLEKKYSRVLEELVSAQKEIIRLKDEIADLKGNGPSGTDASDTTARTAS